jgi:hypothetical protein
MLITNGSIGTLCAMFTGAVLGWLAHALYAKIKGLNKPKAAPTV